MADSEIQAAKTNDKLNPLFRELSTTPATNAEHMESWDALWRDGSFLPWERGAPHPALYDALAERRDILGDALCGPDEASAAAPRRRRRTALVPGCGRAYDVYLLRAFGYDVVGLESSAAAQCQALDVGRLVDAGMGPGDGAVPGVGYTVVDEHIGLGSAHVLREDFFELQGHASWDLIFDYTFLSALPPSVRPKWAATYARLLAPGGRLICSEFPTQKPLNSGGPPWALPEEVYLAHLQHPGVELPYDAQCRVQFDPTLPPARNGLQRVARWQPARTHTAGQGTDWISVWRHVAR